MDQSNLLRRPVKSGKAKSKSGCRTCKFRKVKCDETWPICIRCQSTNRTCGGYGVWGGGSNPDCGHLQAQHDDYLNSSISSRNSSTSPSSLASMDSIHQLSTGILTGDEQYCLDWYIKKTSIKLPGPFVSDFWTNLLIQGCSTEPAVLHAVLALSSTHRLEVLNAEDQNLEEIRHQKLVTAQQQSKAIKSLETHFANTSRASVRVVLISCIMFIYKEFLNGNYQASITHLQHGLRLLHETYHTVSNDGISAKQAISYVDGWIITHFTRLVVQFKLFGQHIQDRCFTWILKTPDTTTRIFTSVNQARRILEHILLRIFYLEDNSIEQSCSPSADIDPNLFVLQAQLMNELRSWFHAYEETMDERLHELNFFDSFSYRLLHMYYVMASVMADTCVGIKSESSFDHHSSNFQSIITLCLECHKMVSHGKRQTAFHVHDTNGNSISDMGWIPPLYYTALKCRDRPLRMRALQLLDLTPHKEGLWDAKLVATIAREAINIEEQEFYNNVDNMDIFGMASYFDTAIPTLPAEYRIRRIELVLPDSPTGRLQLTCNRQHGSDYAQTITKEYNLASQSWVPEENG